MSHALGTRLSIERGHAFADPHSELRGPILFVLKQQGKVLKAC